MARLDINPAGEKQGLIPTNPQVPQLKPTLKVDTIVRYSLMVVGIFVVAAILLFGFNLTQKTRIKSFQNKISQSDQELAQNAKLNQEAEAVFGQVENLQSLWSKRTLWSNLLSEISSTISKSTKINSFAVDEKGQLSLTGKVDSLSSLARTITSLENNDNFSAINLTSMRFAHPGINFEITMNFSESLLSGEKKSGTNENETKEK